MHRSDASPGNAVAVSPGILALRGDSDGRGARRGGGRKGPPPPVLLVAGDPELEWAGDDGAVDPGDVPLHEDGSVPITWPSGE
jgi:hypothetical protein